MNDARGSSVDPKEVEFYTRLAERWWDADGPFWPLHLLNALRTEWIVETLAGPGAAGARPLEGLSVLDIGCGGGLLAEAMAVRGARVTGIDVTPANIEVARLHAPEALGIDYRLTSAETLAAAAQRYDVVLNMEVVEHVADLRGFMAAACSLVAPGGTLFTATLNRSLAGFVIGIVGAEYVTRLLPRGTHRWSRFVRPAELVALLREGGLEPIRRSGVRVNPWRRRMSLTRWEGVNYMMAARRP